MPLKSKDIAIIDNIIITENIYVYQKNPTKFFSKRVIAELFSKVKSDKGEMGIKVLADLKLLPKSLSDSTICKFSLLVFSYVHKANFIEVPIPGWQEQRMAYLMLLDFGGYVFILRRNISGINDFIDDLVPIEYVTLMKLYQQDGTVFEKFSMNNLDPSREAMQSKMAESNNLEGNFNYVGANTYALNHLRLRNDTQRYLLSLKSSRVNKTGEKVSIDKLAASCGTMVKAIEKFKDKESILDVFAAPCDYSKERNSLVPMVVTLQFDVLLEEFDSGKVAGLVYEYEGRDRSIDFFKYLQSLNLPIPLTKLDDVYSVAPNRPVPRCLRHIGVGLFPKSIRIVSSRFRRIKVLKAAGRRENIVDYLNARQFFQVNFDACEYVYSNRKLFRDSSLLGSIPYFLQAFEANPKLKTVTSEKGTITSASTFFQKQTVFAFVEDKFKDSEFMVLDDLGDEWADHICISESTITFIHSKFDTTSFSATSFSDIVTQAKKNMGNMLATPGHVEAKKRIWKQNYVLNGVTSKIRRLRKGVSVDAFAGKFVDIRHHANPRRCICLALNFMSLTTLTNNLTELTKGTSFKQRRQAIQILWVISSLIASCRDNGIELKVMCAP